MPQHTHVTRAAGTGATAGTGRWRLVLASTVAIALIGVVGTASSAPHETASVLAGGQPAVTEHTTAGDRDGTAAPAADEARDGAAGAGATTAAQAAGGDAVESAARDAEAAAQAAADAGSLEADAPTPVGTGTEAGTQAGSQVAAEAAPETTAGTSTGADAGTSAGQTAAGTVPQIACPVPDAATADPTGSTTTYSASGQAMPVGDLPGWRQVFTDDFATPVPLGTFTRSAAYSPRWLAYGPYKDTSGRGIYDADKTVSVANGVLDINVHTENGQPYVAALVPHQPKAWGQTYGRYSFRFRADTLPGYKMVGILWPDSDNWGEGEIDFPEVTHLATNEKIYANVFQKGSTATGKPGPASRFTSNVAANVTGWHTATIEWLPGSVTMWLDGSQLGQFTQGIPDTSFHLVFQIETNLSDAKPAEAVSGHIQLDWVTFYQRF